MVDAVHVFVIPCNLVGGIGCSRISCFFLDVNLNVNISDLLGAIWRLEDFEILRISQEERKATRHSEISMMNVKFLKQTSNASARI